MGDPELISIYDACKIFNGLSIEAMRKYKLLGLIEPCKRVGRKDLYHRETTILRKHFIESKKKQGKSLQEIAKALQAPVEELDIADEHSKDEKAKKLLIVEDLEFLRKIMFRYLRTFFPEDHLAVYHTGDGSSGIDIAEKIEPDLIVLDIALPVLSGIEVYEKLKKHPRLSHSKFIIISANIEYKPQDVVFLEKPLKMDFFIKTVEELTGLRAQANQSVCMDFPIVLTP